MDENDIGTLNFGEMLMKEGITRAINGCLSCFLRVFVAL